MQNLTQLAQFLSATVIAAGLVIGLGGAGAAIGFGLLGGKFLAESRIEGSKRGTKISIELPIAK